jgi:hypothetical protein
MSYLQSNSGNNYSLYYNILDYFKTIMNNHPTIAQVAQGDLQIVDDNVFTLYPLGQVTILGANFGEKTTDYTIQLVVADKIKNKNNESEPRTNAMNVPFTGTDDVVDIWANTLSVVNDLVSFTQYSLQSFAINGEIINEPFEERFNNGLAGWVSTFTLTTHNDRPRCLYNLYETPATKVWPFGTTLALKYSTISAADACSKTTGSTYQSSNLFNGQIIVGSTLYHNSPTIFAPKGYYINQIGTTTKYYYIGNDFGRVDSIVPFTCP